MKDQPRGVFAFARAPSQKPVSAQSARAYLRGMLRKAGIEKKWIGPHELRHAYATNPLDAGAERADSEAPLGGEPIATAQVCTDAGPERMERVAGRL